MSTTQPTVIPLPERPNLEQLKKQAREASQSLGVKLTEAQLHVARGYGFASWPKLKQHVDLVTAYTRLPDELAGDDFLSLACLTYGDDSRERWERAAQALIADPSLSSRDTWHAAACANPAAINPVHASLQHRPFGWEPLMYLCHARLPVSETATLATANALLDAAADPNVGYLWHGLPSPFTALTGVLGSGEGDQPPHQHWKPLARLLLERGANANDAQGLYNRQFRANNEHLELLFEFGLGQGDGGQWKQRLGSQMESPTEMVQHQLRWAIHHNMLGRVRLFAEHGVDLNTPFDQPQYPHASGRTPSEWAALCGHRDVSRVLFEHGALTGKMSMVDRFIAAIMAGDGLSGDATEARAARPSLVVQAAATGRLDAVRLAVANGFDVNALGRADAPCEQPWQTALHTAVERDDARMVRLLLSLGADRSITDARFNATPLGWCDHFGNTELAETLK